KNYRVKHYNLDAIISVGYRINSVRATQFRIWATKTLKEYIVKGFALDDERLKNPDLPFDYFEELTRRIQDIRTSEKRFYRKITDIYALSV
ncbi:MAG TPA: hydroxyacid dehydrogenase, partial [Coxiellaceae bacterium]|nr:hydroxyacid dehydrogenase [Coxiellaceae bacterium]